MGIFTQVMPTAVAIDNWAHGGGFAGGIILAWFIGAHFRLEADSSLFGARLVDDRRLSKTWYFAALYAAGLAILTVYALNALGG